MTNKQLPGPIGQRKSKNALSDLISRFRLTWRLVNDSRVPLLTKSIPMLSLLYLIFPIDLIPDIWPVIGQLDDIGVIMLGLTLFVRLCPPDVVRDHQDDIGERGDEDDDDDVIDVSYTVKKDLD